MVRTLPISALPSEEPEGGITRPEWGLYPLVDNPPATDILTAIVERRIDVDVEANVATAVYVTAPREFSNQEIAEHLAERLFALADLRWRREEAGIAWVRPSDSRVFGIATDRESQAKMQAERSAARDGLRTDGAGWKCLDAATGRIVWEPMQNTDVEAFAADAWAYVSAFFAREGALGADLYAAAADDGRTAGERIAAIEAVDLEAGWP